MAIKFDNPTEHEVFRARESNVPVLLRAIPIIVVGIVVAVAVDLLGHSDWILWVALITVVVAVVACVPHLLANLATDVVVTDRRLYFRSGIINIKDHVTELSNISDVAIDPSVFGRIFNYADVKIQTVAGEEDFDFKEISHAYDMRRAISAGGDAERDAKRAHKPGHRHDHE